MREDRSALDLLTADHTFLNERLAMHYGIETVKGSDQVSEAVDGFAEVNDMPSCATFNDV